MAALDGTGNEGATYRCYLPFALLMERVMSGGIRARSGVSLAFLQDSRMRALLTMSAAIYFLAALAVQAQPCWPQFRGPNGQGVVETADPPVHFNASSNLVWNTATPPGHSSPCIWGERIFLTTFDNRKLEMHAYDRPTGKRVWQQAVPAERIEKTQPFNSPASSTPVTNVGSATRAIRTGDLVQVDGNRGRVTILERVSN